MFTAILICQLVRPYSYPAFRDDADGVDHRIAIGRNLPYSGMVVGKTEKTIVIQKRGQVAREFPLSEVLASGEVPAEATGGARYSLKDVLIGDLVVISYDTFPQGNVCHAVTIHRRPGGRVPPADDSSATAKYRWHDLANAKQDLEEKGTPV
ncbi:MAG TPA: hypothetical protein VLM40_23215, partial [Gemmata sp.]|nr:hypothetical protein [Gemmata sp.]